MAGYMTKLQGYVYDGELVAAADLKNGDFVEITAENKVNKVAAPVDTTLRVMEKEGPYALDGLRLQVVKQGDQPVFFVENVPDDKGNAEYDEADFVIKAGEFVRIHRLLAGEQLLVTVPDTLFAAVSVGDILTIGIGGALAIAQ